MQNVTEKQVIQALAMVSMNLNRPIPEGLYQLWVQAFCNEAQIDQADFSKAITKVISTMSQWPTIADINAVLNVIAKYRIQEPKALASVDCKKRQQLSKQYLSQLKALASA